MSKTLRQSLAIFLMLWLPIFSGSALAMMPCSHMMSQDASMSSAGQADHCNMSQPAQPENSDSSCDQCGQCHVACSPGITSSLCTSVTTAASAEHPTPIALFHSVTLPLLDPPPLVRI